MIVLYSSFFFERDIRKLRYPIKHQDGSLTTVTVSMLDDFVPSAAAVTTTTTTTTSRTLEEASNDAETRGMGAFISGQNRQITANVFREDFELYKVSIFTPDENWYLPYSTCYGLSSNGMPPV